MLFNQIVTMARRLQTSSPSRRLSIAGQSGPCHVREGCRRRDSPSFSRPQPFHAHGATDERRNAIR